MQGDKECIVIAEGIHMLNPLIFDKIRGAATGIYVAPRTRILTNKDRVVRPEQLRVARRLIRDYNTRGHSLRETVERAESVNAGEVNYIRPFKSNAAIHIDSFHDYEPCILAKCLANIPNFRQELTPGVYAGARPHRPGRGGGERPAFAHALCAAEFHRPRVRGRQQL